MSGETMPARKYVCKRCGRRVEYRTSRYAWVHAQPVPPEEDHPPIPVPDLSE
jgi:hypothetical protein